MLSSARKSWCERFVWETAFLRAFGNDVTQIKDRTCVLPSLQLSGLHGDTTHFPSQKRERSQAVGVCILPSHVLRLQQTKSLSVN